MRLLRPAYHVIVTPVSYQHGEGYPMHIAIDDCAKRRLTERIDILTAVNILESRGVRREDLIVEMTKIFYVDLDEFNRVLRLSS